MFYPHLTSLKTTKAITAKKKMFITIRLTFVSAESADVSITPDKNDDKLIYFALLFGDFALPMHLSDILL
jgi:hypothetical protein